MPKYKINFNKNIYLAQVKMKEFFFYMEQEQLNH